MSDHLLSPLVSQQLAIAYRSECTTGKFDLRNLLSYLPSDYIEPAEIILRLKPNIKSKTAFVGNIFSLCGSGDDPVEDMSAEDFRQVCRYLMDPGIAKEHSYGDGRIIADMMAAYDIIRERKRRIKRMADEEEEKKLIRRQREEQEQRLKLEWTPEKVAENKRLTASLIRSLADRKPAGQELT